MRRGRDHSSMHAVYPENMTKEPVILPFANRREAANRLADALEDVADEDTLVLAIPRGGVPIGRVVADRLGADLDVVLARKLGSPFNPEFAIGAIDETGWVHLSPEAAHACAGADYLKREKARQQHLIDARRTHYRGGREPIPARGRRVIVVDDGLATGATMIAALHAARARDPDSLVCAVPVAAVQAVAAVRPLADRFICLATPPDFGAVGQFYRDFRPVEDTDVRALLEQPRRRRPST